jgi:hypothetical protein
MYNRHARVRVLTATRSRVLCHAWSSCRHAVSPASAGGRDTSSMSSEPVGAASRAAIPSNGHHRHRALSGKERILLPNPPLSSDQSYMRFSKVATMTNLAEGREMGVGAVG